MEKCPNSGDNEIREPDIIRAENEINKRETRMANECYHYFGIMLLIF